MESMPEDSHDIRNQITASIIRHQRCWEPPFRSQLADDPQVLPDAGLKAQVGRDLFLDEKLPRGAGGQGYVAVTETSIVWKESRAAEVFTYQGLTMMLLFIGTHSVTTTLNVHSRSRSFVGAIDLRGLAPSVRLFRRPNTNGMKK